MTASGLITGVCAFGQTERTEAVAKFLYGKGDYSTSLYTEIMKVCPPAGWTGETVMIKSLLAGCGSMKEMVCFVLLLFIGIRRR